MDKTTVVYLFSILFAIGVDAVKKDTSTLKESSAKSVEPGYSKGSQYYGDEGGFGPMYGGGYGGGLGGLGGLGGFGLDRGLFDPSFLLPIIVCLGFGALLLPLLGSLLGSIFVNPVNTLVTGRRRRSVFQEAHPIVSEIVSDVWGKVEKAIEKYHS